MKEKKLRIPEFKSDCCGQLVIDIKKPDDSFDYWKCSKCGKKCQMVTKRKFKDLILNRKEMTILIILIGLMITFIGSMIYIAWIVIQGYTDYMDLL